MVECFLLSSTVTNTCSKDKRRVKLNHGQGCHHIVLEQSHLSTMDLALSEMMNVVHRHDPIWWE